MNPFQMIFLTSILRGFWVCARLTDSGTIFRSYLRSVSRLGFLIECVGFAAAARCSLIFSTMAAWNEFLVKLFCMVSRSAASFVNALIMLGDSKLGRPEGGGVCPASRLFISLPRQCFCNCHLFIGSFECRLSLNVFSPSLKRSAFK